LIEHSSMRLDILYFLGYNIDEALPWHSTVSRTRQLFPEKVFESVFTKIFSLCAESGLVSGHTQATDAAPIKANASIDSLVLIKYRQPGINIVVPPNARISVKPEKTRKLNYLGNITVDTSYNIISDVQAYHTDQVYTNHWQQYGCNQRYI